MSDGWAFNLVLLGGSVTTGALVLLWVGMAGLSVGDAVTAFMKIL